MRRRRAPLDEKTLRELGEASEAARPVGSSCGMFLVILFAINRGSWRTACGLCLLTFPFLVYDMYAARGRLSRIALSLFYLILFLLIVNAFAGLYLELGLLDERGTRVTQYRDSLYFSLITWTTVGYGDVRPSPDARLWCAAEALAGYLYMALLVGHLLNTLGRAPAGPGEARGRTTGTVHDVIAPAAESAGPG